MRLMGMPERPQSACPWGSSTSKIYCPHAGGSIKIILCCDNIYCKELHNCGIKHICLHFKGRMKF